jgi:glycolate oxidase FAD binding subunit
MQPMDQALSDVTERINTSAATRTPLRIRGGGSKDFYGQSLQGEVLDTTGLAGIISYEPSELVVTAGAGTTLDELETLLAKHGQSLAFEPPRFAWSGAGAGQGPSTVGGMVASGLSGPARASVGGVRDYVLGLKMINGKGEHLSFGGQVMKNVAGYDVSRLMAGAMGTLGLITEVSLKVLPVAPAEATLMFELNQSDALEQLHRWGGEPLPLNASCWVHDDSARTSPTRDLLFVRLRGAVAAVEAACKKMLSEQPGKRMVQQQATADWELCRNQALPFFNAAQPDNFALWRLSVAQTTPALQLPWAQLVEWHGAMRWLWAPHDAGEQLQAAASSAGGFATTFVAAQAQPARATHRFAMQSATQTAVARRLKASFDPQGIFNPGRLFADL